MVEATRICPYCAETVKADAKVCRYCGRELKTSVERVSHNLVSVGIGLAIAGVLVVIGLVVLFVLFRVVLGL